MNKAQSPGVVDTSEQPDHRWVTDTLASLTLDQKIGQLLHPHLMPEKGIDEELEKLAGIEVGGAFFFGAEKTVLQTLSQKVQSRSPVPVVVSSDLESGAGRMVADAVIFPDAMSIAATGNKELAYQIGEAAAKEGRECGIHWSFAPVIDINDNPHSPIVNTRGFGDHPETIANMAIQMTLGMQQNGGVACAKHFPGDGYDDRDQHLCTSVNPQSLSGWRATSGRLFQQLIDAGVWSIMVGHIALPSVDPGETGRLIDAPSAVISEKIIQTLLREELGFEGVVISDAIGMGGSTSHYPEDEVVVRSIIAGCDMVLFCDPQPAFAALKSAVDEGRLTESRIDQSVRRILNLKSLLGLHRSSKTPEIANEDLLRFRQVAEDTAEKALSWIKQDQVFEPLVAGQKVLSLHLRGDPKYHVDLLDSLLKERGVEVVRLTEVDEFAHHEWDLSEFDALLVNTVFGPSWATNRIRLSGNFNRPLVELLKSGHSQILFCSFGNPYQLYEYPKVPNYLNAYSPDEATQQAYVKFLFGELTPQGQSPVQLEKLLGSLTVS